MKRTVSFDPDYRRDPKTQVFCAICQRDVKKVETLFFESGENWATAVHPKDATKVDLLSIIGSECRKQLPKEYILTLNKDRK